MCDHFGQQLANGQAILHFMLCSNKIKVRRGYVVEPDNGKDKSISLTVQFLDSELESKVAPYNVVIVG